MKAIRESSPQAIHHFTRFDQVHQLVSASEADPDLGFMARLLALCSLPRTKPGQRYRYVRSVLKLGAARVVVVDLGGEKLQDAPGGLGGRGEQRRGRKRGGRREDEFGARGDSLSVEAGVAHLRGFPFLECDKGSYHTPTGDARRFPPTEPPIPPRGVRYRCCRPFNFDRL